MNKEKPRAVSKKRTAFLQNVAKLSAMKLTEMGSPTLPNTGYQEIARRIRAVRPDLNGSMKEVLAAFVDQKDEAKRLQHLFWQSKQKRAQVKAEKGSYAAFYDTEEWRRLRYQVLKRDGGRCALCGVSGKDSVLHVDHIKPRSLFPQLELNADNLQVLCADCNLGKSNLDDTNWRADLTKH